MFRQEKTRTHRTIAALHILSSGAVKMRDRGEPDVFVRTRPGSPREIEGNRERLRLACESAAGALAGRGAVVRIRWEDGKKG